MAETFGTFLHDQFFKKVPQLDTNLAGKTTIVTGSNVGLGLEAARLYTQRGATVILAVRNVSKGEDARQDILNSLKVSNAKTSWQSQGPTGGDVKSLQDASERVKVWQLDLGSYASVIAFAERCEKELDRLDIVLENAGIATEKFELAEDNESTITVNVISTFLLAHLLVPKLKDSARKYNIRPVVAIMSSGVHYWTKIPERTSQKAKATLIDALNDESLANMKERYMVSKLMEVFFVREFAENHSASDFPITINLTDPGFCWSALGRDSGVGMWLMRTLLARSTADGGRTIAFSGTQDERSHGEFFANCEIREVAKFATSPEGVKLQKQVYEEVNAKLEKIKPGCTKV